jgi:hypothetical protein
MIDYSEDASISQVRGRRVLKELTKARSHGVRSTAANASDDPADESVLVFYDDVDEPQQHRVADCARLRASTLGRSDTPHHSGLPVGWRNEETIDGHEQSVTANPHGLGKSPEVDTTELPKGATLQHALDACPVNNTTTVEDYDKQHRSLPHSLEECPVDNTPRTVNAKQQRSLSHSLDNCASDGAKSAVDPKQHRSLPHSLSGCTGDVTTTANEVDMPSKNTVESTQQHLMEGCANDNTTTATTPISAEKVSQHILAECPQTVAELKSVGSATLGQHAINDCPVSSTTMPSKTSVLEQHVLTDCAIVSDAQVSHANSSGAGSQSPEAHCFSGSKPAIEQNESNTAAITVPQPPDIIVTSADTLEDLPGQQQNVVRSKSSEILFISRDSKISVEQEVPYEAEKAKAGPFKHSKHRRDDDGATDAAAEYDDPLSHAAAALRKVLDAATTERRSKTPDTGLEFIWNDPVDVKTDAAAAKKSVTKARSKAVAGRGQRSKGEF